MPDDHHFIRLDNLFTEEVYHLKILLFTYLFKMVIKGKITLYQNNVLCFKMCFFYAVNKI